MGMRQRGKATTMIHHACVNESFEFHGFLFMHSLQSLTEMYVRVMRMIRMEFKVEISQQKKIINKEFLYRRHAPKIVNHCATSAVCRLLLALDKF